MAGHCFDEGHRYVISRRTSYQYWASPSSTSRSMDFISIFALYFSLRPTRTLYSYANGSLHSIFSLCRGTLHSKHVFARTQGPRSLIQPRHARSTRIPRSTNSLIESILQHHLNRSLIVHHQQVLRKKLSKLRIRHQVHARGLAPNLECHLATPATIQPSDIP